MHAEGRLIAGHDGLRRRDRTLAAPRAASALLALGRFGVHRRLRCPLGATLGRRGCRCGRLDRRGCGRLGRRGGGRGRGRFCWHGGRRSLRFGIPLPMLLLLLLLSLGLASRSLVRPPRVVRPRAAVPQPADAAQQPPQQQPDPHRIDHRRGAERLQRVRAGRQRRSEQVDQRPPPPRAARLVGGGVRPLGTRRLDARRALGHHEPPLPLCERHRRMPLPAEQRVRERRPAARVPQRRVSASEQQPPDALAVAVGRGQHEGGHAVARGLVRLRSPLQQPNQELRRHIAGNGGWE